MVSRADKNHYIWGLQKTNATCYDKRMGNKTLPLWAVNLKLARKKREETQEEFGKRFGVTQQAVAFWESGTYEPAARVFVWLLVELGAITTSSIADYETHDWTVDY